MMLTNFRFERWTRSDGAEFMHLFCHLEIGEDRWNCLVDTGSDISLVVSKLAKLYCEKSGFTVTKLEKARSFFGQSHTVMEVDVYGNKFSILKDFNLKPLEKTYSTNVDLLIGNNLLKKHEVILDYSTIP